MRIPTLTTDYSLSELRREARYTLAIARVQSWASSHVPILEADLKDVGSAEAELASLQDKLEDAQAAVDAVDQHLDVFVLDTAPDAREAVQKDTDAPLWKALYDNQRPSDFVRPKLGEELAHVRKWPALLRAAASPALQGRVSACEALIKAADSALEGLSDAQSALQVFKSAKVPALVAKLNATRSALGSAGEQLAFAGKIRAEAAQGLFRRSTRTRSTRPETTDQLRADIAETEKLLIEQRQRLAAAEAAEKNEHEQAAQRQLDRQALEAARAQQAETAAKIAALESRLKG